MKVVDTHYIRSTARQIHIARYRIHCKLNTIRLPGNQWSDRRHIVAYVGCCLNGCIRIQREGELCAVRLVIDLNIHHTLCPAIPVDPDIIHKELDKVITRRFRNECRR